MLHLRKFIAVVITLALSISAQAQATGQAKAQTERILPGQKSAGMLLSNGWTLTPEGKQIPVSDLPMNMELSKDGRFLLVTTNGNGEQEVDIIDTTSQQILQTVKIPKSWLGFSWLLL